MRDGIEHKITFKEGEKTADTKTKTSKHGTYVKFIPSKKYLGKSAVLDKKLLTEWISNISYFIPNRCKITFEIRKGLDTIEVLKFKHKGFVDLLKSHIGSNETYMSQLIHIDANQKMEEPIITPDGKSKSVKRNLNIECAFAYTDTIEPYVDSYCNYINTISGGVHLEACKEAIWRFFMKKTNETLTEKEKEKWKVLKVDIEQGLNIVVNLFTDMQMQLVGQTKNAVGNDELYDPIKKLVTDELNHYFENNKAHLASITKLIKTNCRARIEASKVRTSIIKDSKDKFDKFKFDKFTPCNNEGKQYKELHLCEGDSASGSLVDGRDPDTQAFLAFRGVGKSAFKANVNTILDNAEWNTYIKLIKTNWGPKFDASKCYYDKIIIDTDADVDGYNISSIIGAFHAVYLPQLVQDGRLYKSYPPLYKIDDKKHQYTRDKKELVELYQSKIVKRYSIIIGSSKNKPLSDRQFKQFIYDTETYPSDLVRIAGYFGKGMNKFLIERIAAWLVIHYYDPAAPATHPMPDLNELFTEDKFRLKFSEMLQKKFPEMFLRDKCAVRGIIDGKTKSVHINNRFIKKTLDLFPIYLKYGYTVYVKDKKEKTKYKKMSIGEFLDLTIALKSRVLKRFKGLGELNSKELWDTTLNPDNRILVQLTMDDVEKDLKIFEKLHGQSKENLEERKKMMAEYTIARDDLDN